MTIESVPAVTNQNISSTLKEKSKLIEFEFGVFPILKDGARRVMTHSYPALNLSGCPPHLSQLYKNYNFYSFLIRNP
jgi:hypothetical protein